MWWLGEGQKGIRTSSMSDPESRLRRLLRRTSLVMVVPTERPTTEPSERKRYETAVATA